jgi:hypothetical protein
MILPNVLWNASHHFATLSHTADNAGWHGSMFRPGKAAEFIGSQFGVLGPVLFGTLLAVVWSCRRGFAMLPDESRLLLAFSVPVVAFVAVQAFISHALANWAAPAYVAGVILSTAVLMQHASRRWLGASLAIGAIVALALPVAASNARSFLLPNGSNPFARTLGNQETAAAVREEVARSRAAGNPYAAIVSDSREVIAALLYYGRDLDVPVYAWQTAETPRNHFELTRPFANTGARPVLFVSTTQSPANTDRAFRVFTPMATRTVAAGRVDTRSLYVFKGE